ncbi:MAG: DUF3400 domain-containing protein, partial [Neisseria subflava]
AFSVPSNTDFRSSIEMVKHILGENWLDEFVKKANNGGVEKVLL